MEGNGVDGEVVRRMAFLQGYDVVVLFERFDQKSGTQLFFIPNLGVPQYC